MKILREQILIEMSQVAVFDEMKACIWVHPSKDRNGAYFKLYDGLSIQSAKRCARIDFMSPKYHSHKDELGKAHWNMNNKEIRQMISLLDSQNEDFPSITNWTLCKWIWNSVLCPQFGIHLRLAKFLGGEYDNKEEMPVNFVPLSHSMPNYLELNNYIAIL